jgi:hypothetical protein
MEPRPRRSSQHLERLMPLAAFAAILSTLLLALID